MGPSLPASASVACPCIPLEPSSRNMVSLYSEQMPSEPANVQQYSDPRQPSPVSEAQKTLFGLAVSIGLLASNRT